MDILELLDGDIPTAVAAVGALSRAVWRSYLGTKDGVPGDHPDQILLPAAPLRDALALELRSLPACEALHAGFVSHYVWEGDLASVPRGLFHVPDVAWDLISRRPPEAERHLPGRRRHADLKYHAVRDVRRRYGISWSASCVQALLCVARAAYHEMHAETGPAVQWLTLAHKLDRELECSPPSHGNGESWSDLLLELGAIHGLLRPLTPPLVELRREYLNPESLIGQLFGIPTSICGFDDMFGGGGLMLVDSLQPLTDISPSALPIGGRTVLAIGPFGSGKSSLSLQMAVEVARKGGVAWVMALEQSAEECCIALESLGITVRDASFRLIMGDPSEAFDIAMAPDPGRGALILDASRPRNNDLQLFLDRLRAKLQWLLGYPLRLIVVDPVNAIFPADHRKSIEFRRSTLDLFREAKHAGVNLWLACEQIHERSVEGRFEENIADTVIRLNVERDRPYQQRFIEVTKSRLQKEEPGRHGFTLSGTPGLAIHPSTDAYIRAPLNESHQSTSPLRMIIPGFDEIFGRKAVWSGDIIALHGQTGTSKTLFGLLFLRGSGVGYRPGSACSLWISDFTPAQMLATVDLSLRQEMPGGDLKDRSDIHLHHVRPGFIDPGDILRGIRDKLDTLRDAGRPADRVLISNVSRWELDLPLLKEDLTFGVALLHLLRSYGVTAAIVCGYSSGMSDSALKNVILESSDCLLEFSRLEFRGQDRQFVRALKTHGMAHRRARFELIVGDGGVSITPKESLLRLDSAGNVRHIKINLFLHAETPNHESYNDHIVRALRTTVSEEADIVQQMRRYDTSVLTLGTQSAIDELHILQLDEFQLPQAAQRSGRLFEYPVSDSGPSWLVDRLDRLRSPTMVPGKDRFIAVPFYENISLMAYHRPSFKSFPRTWGALAKACAAWEEENSEKESFFFACPVAQSDRHESYNCLFFEILYSLRPPPAAESCELYDWLFGRDNKFRQAIRYFCTLVRRFHKENFLSADSRELRAQDERKWRLRQVELSQKAVVWRHWYNTLNQMLSEMEPERRAEIVVRPLYGAGAGDTMTTAGQWYLAVPAYSAAPEVALDIIEFLTSPEKELQRTHLGIGLPTRSDFYKHSASAAFPSTAISPYFEFDLDQLKSLVTDRVFRRSRFNCYETYSELVSSHLVRVLELPQQNLDRHIDGAIQSLQGSFEFIRRREVCDHCKAKRNPPAAFTTLTARHGPLT